MSNIQYPIFNRGQTLAILLVFMVVALTVISGAATLILVNSQAMGKIEGGIATKALAETGVENALIRILRDPNYSGETLLVEGATVVVSVSGSDTKTIEVTSTKGNFSRKMEVVASYTNGVLSVNSWKEKF